MPLKQLKKLYPFVVITLLILIFSRLAREVIENETFKLDLSINSWVHGLRSPFWTEIMKTVSDIGLIGGVFVIGFISAYWFYHKRLQMQIGLLTSSLGASLFTYFIKLSIARDRPELTSRLVAESGFSFPSGHATTAFTAFGILSVVIYFSHKIPQQIKFFSIVFLSAFALLVGFSRLYLGVHYFTDVAAGAIVGLTATYIFYYLKSKNHND